MSLRDQLVAKGLASKRDRRRANQSLRSERKRKQGSKKKKRALKAERDAERQAQEAALLATRGEIRREMNALRALHDHRQRVYRLIQTNEVRSRGPIRFHHRALRGAKLRRVAISYGVATALRRGQAAIVGFDHGGGVEYRIVSASAATELASIAPEVVVFHVKDAAGLPDPAEEFWTPDQDIDLRSRRATAADLERLRQ